jgi:hypothetical protein
MGDRRPFTYALLAFSRLGRDNRDMSDLAIGATSSSNIIAQALTTAAANPNITTSVIADVQSQEKTDVGILLDSLA